MKKIKVKSTFFGKNIQLVNVYYDSISEGTKLQTNATRESMALGVEYVVPNAAATVIIVDQGSAGTTTTENIPE